MGTISFDPAKITSAASDYDTLRTSISTQIKVITDSLDVISNPANWSGPIANTAKSELENAKEALKSIDSNMNVIGSILSEAATNFGKIQY